MARNDFRLNRAGVGQFLKGPEVRERLREIGTGIAGAARASAPVDEDDYRASIGVVEDTTDRAVVRVVARDKKAVWVEARTANLKRAMRR